MLVTAVGWNGRFGPFFLLNVFFICMEATKTRIWSSFYGFYPPKRDVFQLGVWCQNWGANVRIEVQRWKCNEIISYIQMKWSNVRIEVQMSELRWRDFTSAYRGSPPYTLSQNQDNRETGYSILSLSAGKYFSVHSLGHSEYQEIHTSRALNIDSVKINTSLLMMRECTITPHTKC